MKYLIQYRLFESNENLIDLEVIESAKDLALDNLDEGLELEFNVDYESSTILTGKYSHETDKLNWGEFKGNIDENYLIYSFYFNRNGDYTRYSEQSKDLNSTLREMYPDVNIVDDRWANNNKVQALRLYLYEEEGMDEDDVYSITRGYKYYDVVYTYNYDGMEFISCTYDEAYKIAEECVKDWEDQKIINLNLYFRFNCIDVESLADSYIDYDLYREHWKDYGIKSDENGDMDQKSFDDFIESEKELITEDPQDYLKNLYGNYIDNWENKEAVFNAIKDYLVPDHIDILTENIVRIDGLGHTISTYDGKEHYIEYDGLDYCIFRIN